MLDKQKQWQLIARNGLERIPRENRTKGKSRDHHGITTRDLDWPKKNEQKKIRYKYIRPFFFWGEVDFRANRFTRIGARCHPYHNIIWNIIYILLFY